MNDFLKKKTQEQNEDGGAAVNEELTLMPEEGTAVPEENTLSPEENTAFPAGGGPVSDGTADGAGEDFFYAEEWPSEEPPAESAEETEDSSYAWEEPAKEEDDSFRAEEWPSEEPPAEETDDSFRAWEPPAKEEDEYLTAEGWQADLTADEESGPAPASAGEENQPRNPAFREDRDSISVYEKYAAGGGAADSGEAEKPVKREEDLAAIRPEAFRFAAQPADWKKKKRSALRRRRGKSGLRTFFSGKSHVFGFILIIVLAVMSVIGPWLFKGGAHPFGTDFMGRDLFTHGWLGLRTTLLIALVAALADLVIGLMLGMVFGYFGGKADRVLSFLLDTACCIPGFIAALVLMFVLKPGVVTMTVTFALTGLAPVCAAARSHALRLKDKEFIEAARSIGAGNASILFREILPNMIGAVSARAAAGIPAVLFLETFLSFAGRGLPAETCSLGNMISAGFENCLMHPSGLFLPAVLLSLLMAACCLIADGLKEACN